MNADGHGLISVKNTASLNAITEKIIGCSFKVSNTLGVGFLEKVYENALVFELQKLGLNTKRQHPINVLYENTIIGDYQADILVEDLVLVELKAVRAFDEIHTAQCLNYLRATQLNICLLINFGCPKLEIKRIVNNL